MAETANDGRRCRAADHTQGVMIAVATENAVYAPHVLWRGNFPAHKDQVAMARRVTRGVLIDHPGFDVDLVVTLVSELTTNVVRHSGSRSFRLMIARTTDRDLRVTVTDEGRGCTTPHLRPQKAEDIDVGGRGLRIVDQWADRWGITRERGGWLAVWFDLAERTFREYARDLMAERGITLRRLAKLANYDAGYLSRVLNGHKPPSRQLIARVDDALGANGRLLALPPNHPPRDKAAAMPQMTLR